MQLGVISLLLSLVVLETCANNEFSPIIFDTPETNVNSTADDDEVYVEGSQ